MPISQETEHRISQCCHTNNNFFQEITVDYNRHAQVEPNVAGESIGGTMVVQWAACMQLVAARVQLNPSLQPTSPLDQYCKHS
jgi:predicted esterase YcpF (UPF0227 family)